MKLYTKHHFDAAHFLPEYDGKCRNMHGHTWTVEIWIDKKLNPIEDMIIDFALVKRTIEVFDHKCVNDYIYNPTAENIVRYFLRRFEGYDATIKVWESADSCIEGNTNEDL